MTIDEKAAAEVEAAHTDNMRAIDNRYAQDLADANAKYERATSGAREARNESHREAADRRHQSRAAAWEERRQHMADLDAAAE